MAQTENVIVTLPTALPGEVKVTGSDRPRFTARELDMIREHYGQTFSSIVNDDDSDYKYPVLAWLKLRRSGYDLTPADMEDIVIDISGSDQPDPTNAPDSESSPPSAGSGG